MDCPRDKTTLSQVVRKDTTVEVCNQCHGKWLDQGELERLVLGATNIRTTPEALRGAMDAAERPVLFHADASDPDIECPRCNVAMEKVRFESGGAELTADRCATCKGFWFDAGETGALFVFLEERLPVRGIVWALVVAALGLGLLLAYRLLH